jgi:hypothetical protein
LQGELVVKGIEARVSIKSQPDSPEAKLYHVCEVFANELPLDLPLLRTFNAFTSCENRQEWIARCREAFPESKWVVPKSPESLAVVGSKVVPVPDE